MKSTSIVVTGDRLRKAFGRRTVFSGIDFSVKTGMVLGVLGRNGSGKSTLLKMVAGLLAPTSGEIAYTLGGKAVARTGTHEFTGMVSPYLQFYDEFTAAENLRLIASLRCEALPGPELTAALARVGLEQRADDLVRDYSSGMKQRLKYAAACLFRPPLLIVDEPRANLDSDGIEAARRLILERKNEGAVILATNDEEDRSLCDEIVSLDGA